MLDPHALPKALASSKSTVPSIKKSTCLVTRTEPVAVPPATATLTPDERL